MMQAGLGSRGQREKLLAGAALEMRGGGTAWMTGVEDLVTGTAQDGPEETP